jgi:hypothetical protein
MAHKSPKIKSVDRDCVEVILLLRGNSKSERVIRRNPLKKDVIFYEKCRQRCLIFKYDVQSFGRGLRLK